MSYIICIPSYKRSNICNSKTLMTLKKHNIPKEKILVFVANNQELNEYKEILDTNLYSKLIVGKKGLVQQRQFIIDSFPDGQHIVFFDDDVEKIDLKMSNKFKSHSLDYFLKTAFEECKKQKAYIWGVYPVFNPFFRKARPELSIDLRYIVGAFYGIINRPNLNAIKLTITKKNGQKEDVERTLRYFEHDQIVLRFDKIGFETKYYGKEGGLGTFEARLKPMEEATKKLLEKYPNYGTMIKKKTGMTEFKFKKIHAFSKIKGAMKKSKSLFTSPTDEEVHNIPNTNYANANREYQIRKKNTQIVETLKKQKEDNEFENAIEDLSDKCKGELRFKRINANISNNTRKKDEIMRIMKSFPSIGGIQKSYKKTRKNNKFRKSKTKKNLNLNSY